MTYTEIAVAVSSEYTICDEGSRSPQTADPMATSTPREISSPRAIALAAPTPSGTAS